MMLFIWYRIPQCQKWSENLNQTQLETKENRIYIGGEFTRKKCKTAILLYCFHTAGVLHIFAPCNRLGPGTSFYRKSKINIKGTPNYEIGWFHNWPMIISHRFYAFHFTNDSTLIYIPFSLHIYQYKIVYWDGDIMQRLAYIIKTVFVSVTKTVSIYLCWPVTTLQIRIYKVVISVFFVCVWS